MVRPKPKVAVVPADKGQLGEMIGHTSIFLNGTQTPSTYPEIASVNEVISEHCTAYIYTSQITTPQQTY